MLRDSLLTCHGVVGWLRWCPVSKRCFVVRDKDDIYWLYADEALSKTRPRGRKRMTIGEAREVVRRDWSDFYRPKIYRVVKKAKG